MKIFYETSRKLKSQYFYFLTGIALLFITSIASAATIVIGPNTVITSPISYQNVTLDMSHGSFIIRNKASLTIKNSTITGTLSKTNPVLFNVENGDINLTNDIVTIDAMTLPQHPMSQSLEYVIQVALGHVNMVDNTFSINKTFAAGLLITSANFATNEFQISNNYFEKFHGVLYLISSNSAVVSDNTFSNNTYGHIVSMGDSNSIVRNKIYYSGNNRLGNAIDIINSHDSLIRNNEIYTPTCHAIYLINSHDINIDKNRIVGGITYAINLLSYPEGVVKGEVDEYLKDLIHVSGAKTFVSTDIKVTNNYMAQNRFGIAATDIDNLLVQDNIFIQRFLDDESRIFWTNNNILFKNVTNVTWINNRYKEAYSQAIDGDDSHSNMTVPFPSTGGVHF